MTAIEKIQTVITPLKSIDKINEIIEKINNTESVGLSIGTIFPCVCSANWTPENALAVDGTEYASTQFPTLWTDYLTAETPKLAVCTYAEYAADITAYGQCARFAVDIENGKFKVPTIKDGSYITQALSDTQIGKAYNESLPNIHGYFTGGSWGLGLTGATGAFTPTRTSTNETGTSGKAFNRGAYDGALFDASKSSAVYADNAKVQGDNVRLRWFVVVANGTVGQTAMDWSAWATSLTGKANTDFTNVSATGKSTASGWVMPDFSAGVSANLPFTAPKNGICAFEGSCNSGQYFTLFVNGNKVGRTCGTQQTGNASTLLFKVQKNDVITYEYSYNEISKEMTFFPLKGAN